MLLIIRKSGRNFGSQSAVNPQACSLISGLHVMQDKSDLRRRATSTGCRCRNKLLHPEGLAGRCLSQDWLCPLLPHFTHMMLKHWATDWGSLHVIPQSKHIHVTVHCRLLCMACFLGPQFQVSSTQVLHYDATTILYCKQMHKRQSLQLVDKPVQLHELWQLARNKSVLRLSTVQMPGWVYWMTLWPIHGQELVDVLY